MFLLGNHGGVSVPRCGHEGASATAPMIALESSVSNLEPTCGQPWIRYIRIIAKTPLTPGTRECVHEPLTISSAPIAP
jgi:hypothetical protein